MHTTIKLPNGGKIFMSEDEAIAIIQRYFNLTGKGHVKVSKIIDGWLPHQREVKLLKAILHSDAHPDCTTHWIDFSPLEIA